jgi:hypothetical protein
MDMDAEEKKQLGLEVGAGIITDPAIAAALFKRLAKTKLLKAAATRGGKVGFKFGAKAGVQLASKLALKGATFASKSLTKLSSGPIGIALIAFDVFTLALDIWDPAGYGETLDNGQLDEIKQLYEEGIKEELKKSGTDYPILFNDANPLEYDDEWNIIGEEDVLLMTKYRNDYYVKNNIKPPVITEDDITDEDEDIIDEIVEEETSTSNKLKIVTEQINNRINQIALKLKIKPEEVKIAIAVSVVLLILIIALL